MGILKFFFGRQKAPRLGGERQSLTAPFARSKPPSASIQWREGSFPMEVVGESYYQDALTSICGRHSRHGHEVECVATIEREPSNPCDPNSVKVVIQGQKVGHLSREQAARVGEQMSKAGLSAALCAARISGGWRTNQYDEGSFGVRLAIPNRGDIQFGKGDPRWRLLPDG